MGCGGGERSAHALQELFVKGDEFLFLNGPVVPLKHGAAAAFTLSATILEGYDRNPKRRQCARSPTPGRATRERPL